MSSFIFGCPFFTIQTIILNSLVSFFYILFLDAYFNFLLKHIRFEIYLTQSVLNVNFVHEKNNGKITTNIMLVLLTTFIIMFKNCLYNFPLACLNTLTC